MKDFNISVEFHCGFYYVSDGEHQVALEDLGAAIAYVIVASMQKEIGSVMVNGKEVFIAKILTGDIDLGLPACPRCESVDVEVASVYTQYKENSCYCNCCGNEWFLEKKRLSPLD